MIVSFLEIAKAEYREAYDYYESEQQGLGIRFQGEVYRAVSRIAAHPTAYPKLGERTRRCLVAKFPYGIIFYHSDDEIVIVAVAHLHRKLGYWISRAT